RGMIVGRLEEGAVADDGGTDRRQGPPHVGDDVDELQRLVDGGEAADEDQGGGGGGWPRGARTLHAAGDGGEASDASIYQELLRFGTADDDEIELARDRDGELLQEGGRPAQTHEDGILGVHPAANDLDRPPGHLVTRRPPKDPRGDERRN